MAEECFKWAREAKANAKTWTHDNVDSVGLCTTRGQDMCVLTSARHFGTLVVAFPASAQTSSDSNSTGTAGARAQSELTGGPTSSNPATPEAGSNTATPSIKTNSPGAKAESKPEGAQPESNPGPKKAGSAVLISIDKTKQEMTIFLDGIEKYLVEQKGLHRRDLSDRIGDPLQISELGEAPELCARDGQHSAVLAALAPRARDFRVTPLPRELGFEPVFFQDAIQGL
jgi:hypothetical protein